jgi:hypothetical protein
MIYRLKINEPIAEGMSRVALEQVDMAQTRLSRRTDVAVAIHDTRRCLKRLRALLRLVRPALPEATYRREARRLAGIGRMLAGARDQHVMQQTLAKLEGRIGALSKRVGKQLGRRTANGARSGANRSSAAERRQALEALEKTRAFFQQVAKREITLEHLTQGLERPYRRARRAFREAYETPTDEAFHEWRKSVQQHWRHMQLLSRAWPDVMEGRAREAKELSRLLGDDHDLHVLRTFVAALGAGMLSAEERQSFSAGCRLLQGELRARARPRGARLFAEPAGGLAKRVGSYWRAARDAKALLSEDEAHANAKTPAKRGQLAVRRRAQAASRGAPSAVSGSRGW